MSLTAIVLLTISAVTHAGWNLLSKRNHPSPSFFLIATIVGFVALFPFLVLHRDKLPQFPVEVWGLLIMTGFFLAANYWSLASAYNSGDMSIVYPLARSSPVIVVSIVTLVLRQTDQVSIQCMLGIPLVVGGCFLVPMKRFADLRLKNYLNRACLLAFTAALGTAGYSMVDDRALRLLRDVFGGTVDTVSIVLIYAGLQALSVSLWLAVLVGARHAERVNFQKVMLTGKRAAIIAGIGIFGTYALVLISMAFVTNISYVVAFRQLSIPIGTCFGILILGESPNRPKIAGVCIIFLGLMLVGSG